MLLAVDFRIKSCHFSARCRHGLETFQIVSPHLIHAADSSLHVHTLTLQLGAIVFVLWAYKDKVKTYSNILARTLIQRTLNFLFARFECYGANFFGVFYVIALAELEYHLSSEPRPLVFTQ